MREEKPTMKEIEERIFVSNDEVFAEIARSEEMLVRYTAAKLQNQKMKGILIEHFGEDASEGD